LLGDSIDPRCRLLWTWNLFYVAFSLHPALFLFKEKSGDDFILP
jgi:hypothetical protein